MIVITGAAGFIGSCLAGALNEYGETDLILVDHFGIPKKRSNWKTKKHLQQIEREIFPDWFEEHANHVDFIFHMGARTDTSETDWSIFRDLNLKYSKKIWEICTINKTPLVYASSAATYGSGEHGYKDDHSVVAELRPLNPYGQSKQEFDRWAINRKKSPPFWAGLKFFNVYGPNEYHKGRMASVIFHAYNQIRESGKVKLFKSHNPEFEDGKQLRDFIYVKDVIDVCLWLMENQPASGLYNVGTGNAQTFLELARSVFKAVQKPPEINFVDTPEGIRDKYQYFTEADMHKLREAGYDRPFRKLEEGVVDYVTHYLVQDRYL